MKRLNAGHTVAAGCVVLDQEAAGIARVGIKDDALTVGDGVGAVLWNKLRVIYRRVTSNNNVRAWTVIEVLRRSNRNAAGTVSRPMRIIVHIVIQNLNVIAIIDTDPSSRLVVNRIVLNNDMVHLG